MEMLRIREVIHIHDKALARYGGNPGIKDYGQLESSLNNAFSTFIGSDLYPTDLDKIVNIFYLINKNHCFNDANKRTSVQVFNTLIKINDIEIEYKLQEIEDLALYVADNIYTIEDVKEWIKRHKI